MNENGTPPTHLVILSSCHLAPNTPTISKEDAHRAARDYAAKQRGVLPVNAQGYVVGEYARRQADRYVEDAIAPFFKAVEPVFIPHYCPAGK